MKTHYRVVSALVGILMLAPKAAVAQAEIKPVETAGARLTFEVASIRPSAPLDMARLGASIRTGNMPRFGASVEGTLAEYHYMSLKALIATAYGVDLYQVSGPPWLSTERFDIKARMPDGAPKSDAPRMLQSLLAQPFGLVAHRVSKEHPVLALVVANGGPKLQSSPDAPAPIDLNAPLKLGETTIETPNGPALVTANHDGSVAINMGVRGIVLQKMDAQEGVIHMTSSAVTMAGFADMLSEFMQMGGNGGHQVVDMTGLKGQYKISVDISMAGVMEMARAQGFPASPSSKDEVVDRAPDQVASEPGTGAATVFASVKKLGLNLESRKAQMEQLIVDKVDKIPSPN